MSASRSPRGRLRSIFHSSGKATPARFGVESLEQRALLAAVAWDGGAGDNLWHSANNWNPDGVPVAADDVTINVGTNPTILFNATTGSRTVNSLVSDEAMSFTGGTLTVVTTADINAAISMNNNTISGGAWDVTGATGGGITLGSNGTALNNVNITGDLLMSSNSSFAAVSGTTRFTNARLQFGNASIRFANGYTLNDQVIIEGAAVNNRFIYQSGNGSSTIGATGVIKVAAGAGGGVQFNNNVGTFTLTNNGTIVSEAAGRVIEIFNAALTNNANITSTAGGINIAPTNWTNTGTISVAPTAYVSLGGALNATAGIGSFSNTGGDIYVTGAITNTGNTFALNNSTGSWIMFGGSISGGTINTADGRVLTATSNGGTLANVQFNGDIVMNVNSAYVAVSGTTRFTAARLQFQNSSIRFANGYTLNDQVIIEGAAVNNRFIYSNGAGSSTIGTTGVIRLAAGAGGGVQFSNGAGTLTLTNNGTIVSEAAGRVIDFVNTALTNNANITSTAGGINIAPTNWTNTGTISVAPTAYVSLGGTLNATAGIGSFSNTGGDIYVTGAITNTGNTFALNNSTGSWIMFGGSISGGTINTADGRTLVTTSNGGTLANVQFNGDIVMNVNSAYVAVSGTTRFTTARLQFGNASIRFANGYTLNDQVIIEGAAVNNRFIYSNGAGSSTIGATGVIRLAAGVGGSVQFTNGAGTFTLTNNGTIVNEAAGRTLEFIINSLTNNGTIEATAGNVTITNTTVTNYNAGTNTLTGGAWSFNNASFVWAAATIRNIAAATSVTLGGTTGTFAPFSQLTTNDGLLTINNGRNLTVTPQGGTLTNNGTISSTSGTGTLMGSYTLANNGTLTASGTGTLQVNSPGTVIGTVAPAAGGTVAFGSARNFNSGTLTGAGTIAFNNNAASTVSVAFDPAGLATSGGGQVTFTADVTVGTVTNGGTIVLGLNTLTVTGNYTQTLDGALEITIASLANRGTLDVGGDANLDGAIRVVYAGYTLVREDRTELITTGGAVNGVFFVESLGGIQNVELPRLVYNAQSVEFVVYAAGDFDGDGFITGQDYDIFVVAFEAGDPRVDVDGDGFVTGADFDIFVTAFEQG